MGTHRRRKHKLEYTTGPLSWRLQEYDDFSIKRITLTFDSIPADIENIVLWHKSDDGSDFDCVVRDYDPNGHRYISIEDVAGFESGDFALLEYANNQGIGVRGLAILEV